MTTTTGTSSQTVPGEQTAQASAPAPTHADLPDGLPDWLVTFVSEARLETETLRKNGAHQAATARDAAIDGLLVAATAWLDAEVDVSEAARTVGVCEETIRRAVRRGDIPDQRDQPRGRHRIRRGDLEQFAGKVSQSYDPDADAQDIARLRRQFP